MQHAYFSLFNQSDRGLLASSSLLNLIVNKEARVVARALHTCSTLLVMKSMKVVLHGFRALLLFPINLTSPLSLPSLAYFFIWKAPVFWSFKNRSLFITAISF